jgi:hypothetical protein
MIASASRPQGVQWDSHYGKQFGSEYEKRAGGIKMLETAPAERILIQNLEKGAALF